MTDLTALIARVEALSGPDRQVSTDVNRALRQPDVPRLTGGIDAAMFTTSPHWGPHITASLDAVVALAERVLPGWDWSVHSHKQGQTPSYRDAWGGMRAPPVGRVSGILYESNGYTPTLALLLALLRAVQADQSKETEA